MNYLDEIQKDIKDSKERYECELMRIRRENFNLCVVFGTIVFCTACIMTFLLVLL